MKRTVVLSVEVTPNVAKGHLALHPNEGFDLGLMRLGHPLFLCAGLSAEAFLQGEMGTIEELQIDLLNECPKETLQVNTSLYKTIGQPRKAVVLLDGERLFVHAT